MFEQSHIRGEEKRSVRDIFGLSESSQRDVLRSCFLLFICEHCSHVCFDESRCDRIHSYAASSELFRCGKRHADNAGFRCAVVHLCRVALESRN